MKAQPIKLEDQVSRRTFHAVLVNGLMGAAVAIPEPLLIRDSIFKQGGLSTEQASSFGLTMQPSCDLGSVAHLPFDGAHRHAWCGVAGQFRSSDRTANALAKQCVDLLGMTQGETALRDLMRTFFGNTRVDTGATVFALVNCGHISRTVAFQLKHLKVHLKSPEGCMQRAGTTHPSKIRLGFDQNSSEFSVVIARNPWEFAKPKDNSDAMLWSRRRYRVYTDDKGLDKGTDQIFQFSTADQGGDEPSSLERGGYFPNTLPLRERYSKYGYTDLSTIHLVRTVHRPFGRPKVHEIVLDVNAGVRRSDVGSIPNNPDELLSVLTLNRGLDRFLDDYHEAIGELEQRIA